VVQAGLCHASLGSDTRGSIRQPALFAAWWVKTYLWQGIAVYGLIAYASSSTRLARFTHSIETLPYYGVISGKDNYDSTSSSEKVPVYSFELDFEKKAPHCCFSISLNRRRIECRSENHR